MNDNENLHYAFWEWAEEILKNENSNRENIR
jgi:hypothetical protein